LSKLAPIVFVLAACCIGACGPTNPAANDAGGNAAPDGAATDLDGGSSLLDAATSTDAAAVAGDASAAPGVDASLDWDATIPEPFLFDPAPPSTLLAAGTTQLDLTARTSVPAVCAFSTGADADFLQMSAFASGDYTTTHAARIPVDPDPAKVNEVYVRCAPKPGDVLHLRYRAIAEVKPSYPRTGNLWGWWQVINNGGVAHAARIDLFLGADPKAAELMQLRKLNPNVLVLTSINTVERTDADVTPDDYWLKDVNGRRIEVWPGAYRLNLTRPEVAEFQARYAYQRILDSGLLLDGCFFDNFFTRQSNLTEDMWGNPVQLDADGDGVADDPAALDAKWRAGVFHELETWRKLMPHALASGHLPRPPDAELGALFNGDSIGFQAPQVREGVTSLDTFWRTYQDWWTVGKSPVVTMIEGAPRLEISYGYSYEPDKAIPPATWEYARTDYPAMRFALAATLMGDGYYAYEFGDTWHGNDWWYDELDFKLGKACGPARRVAVGTPNTTNLVANGDFEAALSGTWKSWVDTTAGAQSTFALDTAEKAQGASSMHAHVANAGDGVDWKVVLYQEDRAFVQGVTYDLEFQARADRPRTIGVVTQKQAADWRNYGLSREVAIDTTWKRYVVTFQAKETASDSRMLFAFGETAGDVWIDGVSIVEHPADVFRRDFENGIALFNGTSLPCTISLEPGLKRITGTQAAKHDYVVDDADPGAFTAGADWTSAAYDSGQWTAVGPFFHDWGKSCTQASGTGAQAEWELMIPAADRYTIDVWWPDAPAASSWSDQVVYEVVDGNGAVLATTTLSQRTGGDQWQPVASSLALAPADSAKLRIRSTAAGGFVADAVHVQSASRYNDGSAAPAVGLAAVDGMVLARTSPTTCP
jgi:hypothetical protein